MPSSSISSFCLLGLLLLVNAETNGAKHTHGAVKKQHHTGAKEIEHVAPTAAEKTPTAVFQIVDGKLVMAGHSSNDQVGLLGKHSKEMKQASEHTDTSSSKYYYPSKWSDTTVIGLLTGACALVLMAVLVVIVKRSRAAAPTDACETTTVTAVGAIDHYGWTPGSML
jgi:hypothetical protein